MSSAEPRRIRDVRRVGRTALRVEVPDTATALALAAWARQANLAVTEVVPAVSTVLLDGVADLASVRAAVLAVDIDAISEAQDVHPDVVRIEVTYDGPDLGDVAGHWGVGSDEVAGILADADLVSAFCGFAPGFAYLAGLEERYAVPRLDSPRDRVPAGSVAVADRWCGVYPTSSPGGWRIMGRTDAVLWDQDRADPALLPPGTRVRLVPAP